MLQSSVADERITAPRFHRCENHVQILEQKLVKYNILPSERFKSFRPVDVSAQYRIHRFDP